MDTQKREWDDSYRERDNFLFYPHEEVIAFVSRHIRKRIGLEEFAEVSRTGAASSVLDLGCGIGRHVVYCHEMGLQAYGVDHSEVAVELARDWLGRKGVEDPENRIRQGDVASLPWPDGSFDYAISHGVLDSMHFEVAREACGELRRVMRDGGLFYCDLVSGDDSAHAREYSGEELVAGTGHERGTIQSYFNFGKILQLIAGIFELEQAVLITRKDVVRGTSTARYHLVLRKPA